MCCDLLSRLKIVLSMHLRVSGLQKMRSVLLFVERCGHVM